MIVDKHTDNNGTYTFYEHKILDKKVLFENNKHKVLIIGDSQAGDFINALNASGINNDVDIISRLLSANCGVFYLDSLRLTDMLENGIHKISQLDLRNCQKDIDRIKEDNVVELADIVIFSMSWRNAYIPYVLESISNIRVKKY